MISKSKQRGFTIIEMLIAISIIAIMSTLVAVSFKDFRSTADLNAELERLTSLIRQAQLWALTGQTRNGTRPAGGWAIHLDECNTSDCVYFLYADVFPATPNHTYDPGFDEIVTSIYIDPKVNVETLVPVSGGSLDIAFLSPNAKAMFNGSDIVDLVVITFSQRRTNEQQSMTLNRITNQVDLGN